MRRITIVLVLLLLAAFPLLGSLAQEESIQEAEGVRYQLTPTHAYILGFLPDAQTATIPALFEGLPTAALESTALGDVPELILGEGITSLAAYPALKSSRIRRVTLPSTVRLAVLDKDWGFADSDLDYFPWLEEVTLPANFTDTDLKAFIRWAQGTYWFAGYDLWDLSGGYWMDEDQEPFPIEDVQYRSLTHVRIDPNHPSFYDVEGVVFRKDTDELLACMPARPGAYAVPEGTKSIGEDAFSECDMLEYVSISASVTSIGDTAFSGCASLRTVQLPPTLRSIGEGAFRNCISLTSLVLPDGITVGKDAFEYCTALRAVYAPGASSDIDPSAFLTASAELVVYAPKDTGAYHAAAANDLLWTENNGTPQRLSNPAYIQTAIVRHEDASAKLPLYAQPDEASEVLIEFSVGTTAKVLDLLQDWVHLEFYGARGYMPLRSLELVDKTDALERVLKIDSGHQAGSDAVIYDEPSLNAGSRPTEYREEFTVVQRYGTWYLLDVDGESYYVPVNASQPSSMCFSPGEVAVIAAKSVGLRATLYAAPDKSSDVLGVYYNGTQVQVLMGHYAMEEAFPPEDENADRFYQVQVDGKQGYMDEKALYEMWEVWLYYGY